MPLAGFFEVGLSAPENIKAKRRKQMGTQVLNEARRPQILSVDAHPGYSGEKKKFEEICVRRDAAEREFDKVGGSLAGHRAAAIQSEADAVLLGKRPDGGEIKLSRELSHLRDDFAVLDRAAEMQRAVVQREFALAVAAVMDYLRPEYLKLLDEYSQLQESVGRLESRRSDWVNKVMGAGVRPMMGGNALVLGGMEIRRQFYLE